MRATARIDDDELAAALEDAADELGSRSAAVRAALREAYVDDDADEGLATEAAPNLSLRQTRAHELLVEWAGIGGWVELEAAESTLASELNIPATAVRTALISPLKREGAVALAQGTSSVHVVVGPLPTPETNEPVDTTNEAVATDGGRPMEER
jgi:hypothetical protein